MAARNEKRSSTHVGLTKYLKAAFTNHWNLLAFLGGVGFAMVSGRPDVVMPLVLAGETAYLGLLGTHPKFQKYVDAQAAKANRADDRETARMAARRMLHVLPKAQIDRFETVRSRCADLRRLAGQIRDPQRAGGPPPLDNIQVEGLDRLLWMFLRLLYTQHSLSEFLRKTSAQQIENDIKQLEGRLATFPADGDQRQQRLRKVVQDNLATSQTRLENYRKAEENYELMSEEINRLENTIHSLSELGVNRHEPAYLSGQIDQVADSMVQTEKTMGDLAFVTGLQMANDEVPPMIRAEAETRATAD